MAYSPDSRRKITPNFYWREFERSENANLLDISNEVVDLNHRDNITRLCKFGLEPARELLRHFAPKSKITLNSGYRSQELNAKTPNASKSSVHPLGLAADVEVKDFNNAHAALILAVWVENERKMEYPRHDFIDQLIIYHVSPLRDTAGRLHIGFPRPGKSPRCRVQIYRPKAKGSKYPDISVKELGEELGITPPELPSGF